MIAYNTCLHAHGSRSLGIAYGEVDGDGTDLETPDTRNPPIIKQPKQIEIKKGAEDARPRDSNARNCADVLVRIYLLRRR